MYKYEDEVKEIQIGDFLFLLIRILMKVNTTE
jgi:hypothetical protein